MSKSHFEHSQKVLGGYSEKSGSGSGAIYDCWGKKRVPATGHTPGDNPKGQDGAKLPGGHGKSSY